jgi:hypothetical protein
MRTYGVRENLCGSRYMQVPYRYCIFSVQDLLLSAGTGGLVWFGGHARKSSLAGRQTVGLAFGAF